MKNFKNNKYACLYLPRIDTNQVINLVKSLFEGYPDLILDFNSFLPQEYHITYSELRETEFKQGLDIRHNSETAQLNLLAESTTTTFRTYIFNICQNLKILKIQCCTIKLIKVTRLLKLIIHVSKFLLYQHPTMYAIYITVKTLKNPDLPIYTQVNSNITSQPALLVNTQRFNKDSEQYKSFLDVISFYQSNQRIVGECTPEGKKMHVDVYKNISKIFANNPDLLSEFINFLPEYVTLNPQLIEKDDLNKGKRKNIPNEDIVAKIAPPIVISKEFPAAISNSVINVHKPEVASLSFSTNQIKAFPSIIDDDIPKIVSGWFQDRGINSLIFDDNFLKLSFTNLSPQISKHLIRCLSLYNANHLSPSDASSLIYQALKFNPPLCESFLSKFNEKHDTNVVLAVKATQNCPTDVNISSIVFLFLFYFDLHLAKRIGQSYWPFKPEYIAPKCSGRTKLADLVLNDLYISQPILTEDTPFPGSKKTISLEILNKIEQERYDLDMIIHSNRSAIAWLENAQREIAHSKKSPSIDLNATFYPSFPAINCLKALQRIYGEHISLVIEGLKHSAVETIKLVVNSLKMKEQECSDNQNRMNFHWSYDSRKHSLRALDFQGPSFKISDAKNMRVKNLVRELENNYNETPDFKEISIEFINQQICTDCLNFVRYSVKRISTINKSEKAKIYIFIQSFHSWLFRFKNDKDINNGCMDGEMFTEENLEDFPEFGDSTMFYITTNIYVYLRLFNLFCSRLGLAYELAASKPDISFYQQLSFFQTSSNSGSFYNITSDPGSIFENNTNKFDSSKPSSIRSKMDAYDQFQTMVYNLIDGNIDIDYYEESCRCIFGLNSYVLFTIDKIINGIVRQLTHIAIDSSNQNLLNDLNIIIQKYPSIPPATDKIGDHYNFAKYWNFVFDNEVCYQILVNKDEERQIIRMKFLLIDTGIKQDTVELNESVDDEWSKYMSLFVEIDKENLFQDLIFCRYHRVFRCKNQIEGLQFRKNQNTFLPIKNNASDTIHD
ncbi:hypothetical protein MXB_733, partial [Myxobolus squamalis]